MSMPQQIPGTPRVISPSPTPSDGAAYRDGYFAPIATSATKKKAQTYDVIDEELDSEHENTLDARRARTKSRSPMRSTSRRITIPLSKIDNSASLSRKDTPVEDEDTNGHLSPSSANKGWSWRDFSRSPSPLGLIPIHRSWRVFIHKHEIPRKLLHVSIGFFSLWAYVHGVQTTSITPYLMSALIPIATTDLLRHNVPSFNRFYVRVLGAFMREKEYDGWNGVIWYLLGVWVVLTFFTKDIGMMGVLLLSWCDTAASTFGRAYGRYTPRLRKGKSLAGSLAAVVVGVVTAAAFWGHFAPRNASTGADEGWPFMFQGTLSLPRPTGELLGLSKSQSTISGNMALIVMSLVTGFIASASEVVDLFGWDDNLTIPVLSGLGLWGFLKVFAR